MPWSPNGDGKYVTGYYPWGIPRAIWVQEEISEGGVKISGESDVQIKKAPGGAFYSQKKNLENTNRKST